MALMLRFSSNPQRQRAFALDLARSDVGFMLYHLRVGVRHEANAHHGERQLVQSFAAIHAEQQSLETRSKGARNVARHGADGEMLDLTLRPVA